MKYTPLTINKAKRLKPGDIVYQSNKLNSDGTLRRWKVTGKVKVWKTNINRVKVPVKHGLYTYGYITENNIDILLIEDKE